VASTAIVVFTRDRRVHDHPVLGDALRTADRLVPLFVFDDAILASAYNTPNRTGFLVRADAGDPLPIVEPATSRR